MASHAKVLEEDLDLHLSSEDGQTMAISDGYFVADDRQISQSLSDEKGH